jgi:hypothetical protein
MASRQEAPAMGIATKKRVPCGTRLFPDLRIQENQSADSVFSTWLELPEV